MENENHVQADRLQSLDVGLGFVGVVPKTTARILMKPIKFIGEEIEVIFDKPPPLAKKPSCPSGFIWHGKTFHVTKLLSEWRDFTRRGRFARNMQPHNQRKAVRRGSIGVGRFYFQVQTEDGRIFELYYDRAPKSIDDKLGSWSLYREMENTVG